MSEDDDGFGDALLAFGVEGSLRAFDWAAQGLERKALNVRNPFATEAVRQALARSTPMFIDRALVHLVTEAMDDQARSRVRERTASAVSLGWVLFDGRQGPCRRGWTKHVEICGDDPDVAAKICLAAYIRGGFVTPADYGLFFATWAQAARSAKLIPKFMRADR